MKMRIVIVVLALAASACSLDQRIGEAHQAVCTQEDINNGTCGDTGGGWPQVPQSDPDATSDISSLGSYTNQANTATCAKKPSGTVECCVILGMRNQGYCCAKPAGYSVPVCHYESDVLWHLYWDGQD